MRWKFLSLLISEGALLRLANIVQAVKIKGNESGLLFSHLANWGYQEFYLPRGDVRTIRGGILRTILSEAGE